MVSLPATPVLPDNLLDDEVPTNFIDLEGHASGVDTAVISAEAGRAAAESVAADVESAAAVEASGAVNADGVTPLVADKTGGEDATAPRAGA